MFKPLRKMITEEVEKAIQEAKDKEMAPRYPEEEENREDNRRD